MLYETKLIERKFNAANEYYLRLKIFFFVFLQIISETYLARVYSMVFDRQNLNQQIVDLEDIAYLRGSLQFFLNDTVDGADMFV